MKTDSSFFFTAILLVGLASTARAQPLEYEIRFDNADHHEAEVRLRLESVPLGTLELRMSRSSPRPLRASRVREERLRRARH